MTKKAKILWMDLEMTGLDSVEDRISEVAVIATDWDFKEIATYEAAVLVVPGLMEKRMKVSKDFWDANPQARDGLIEQNKTARSGGTVENELLEFIDQNFNLAKPVLLAGNSIHQDRKFIENGWPELDKKLHYRMLDVSAWKVVFDGKFGKRFAKAGEHRALSDVRGSIEELKYYLKKVKP